LGAWSGSFDHARITGNGGSGSEDDVSAEALEVSASEAGATQATASVERRAHEEAVSDPKRIDRV
jgi:hypothetical protein